MTYAEASNETGLFDSSDIKDIGDEYISIEDLIKSREVTY